MNKIIINADDYGKNEATTLAILQCFKNGWITQTTAMVNMPFFSEALKMAKDADVADKIGLHLNLTEGKPLTEAIKRHREFCRQDGMLFPHRVGNDILDCSLIHVIRDEFRAQIETYCASGLPLLHCDSHHHIHTRRAFAEILLPLLREYGFKSVRNRYTLISRRPVLAKLRPRWWLSFLTNVNFKKMIRRYGLDTTDGFGACTDIVFNRCVNYATFEFMVHPISDDSGLIVDIQDFAKGTGPAMRALSERISQIDK